MVSVQLRLGWCFAIPDEIAPIIPLECGRESAPTALSPPHSHGVFQSEPCLALSFRVNQ